LQEKLSDFSKKFPETDIIKMIDAWLTIHVLYAVLVYGADCKTQF